MTPFVGFDVLSEGEYKRAIFRNVRHYFIDVSKELTASTFRVEEWTRSG
jgi:hypothetical protein